MTTQPTFGRKDPPSYRRVTRISATSPARAKPFGKAAPATTQQQIDRLRLALERETKRRYPNQTECSRYLHEISVLEAALRRRNGKSMGRPVPALEPGLASHLRRKLGLE